VTQDPDELASAHRVIRIGDAAPGDDVRAIGPEPGAARITVTVAPAGEPAGPHVRRDTPLRFTIGERGVTALLGPNGVGKSVLLAALAGQADTRQVTVSWQGAPGDPPILTLQYPELQVFEERIGDEVVYAARMRGRPREEALRDARAAFETVGLAPGFDRRTWELSTGEKRMVETVGALIAPAGVVLLDEPTAGLDARRKEGLARLIAERAAAVPVVIASQDRRWLDALGVTRVEVAGPSADR
jgi:energy-coupling factor transporter ATP-binding protein EcfA2